MIDQKPVAQELSKKIPYTMLDLFLVKPLEKIMVVKEFDEPEAEQAEAVKDDNGVEAVDYKVNTKTKEVEADYQKAVVLKVPESYKNEVNNPTRPQPNIEVGDIIVYKESYSRWFDILKDTQLVRAYDIVAIERPNDEV